MIVIIVWMNLKVSFLLLLPSLHFFISHALLSRLISLPLQMTASIAKPKKKRFTMLMCCAISTNTPLTLSKKFMFVLLLFLLLFSILAFLFSLSSLLSPSFLSPLLSSSPLFSSPSEN
jgi:hypothetical protein